MASKSEAASIYMYPDPMAVETLSGAAFLYFQRPLFSTLPPTVMTEGSFSLVPLIRSRQPQWAPKFFYLFDSWRQQWESFRSMLDAIQPLRERGLLKTVALIYPANAEAFESSDALVRSAGLSIDSVVELVNPLTAAGEVFRHIMLERFLELNEDIDELYKYCDHLFDIEPLEHWLVKGYLLRLPMLVGLARGGAPVALTNERLLGLLSSMPVEPAANKIHETEDDISNLIAWELFRQILSPRLDPVDAKRAAFIGELLDSRTEEIDRLKSKCLALAEELKEPPNLEQLPSQIAGFVRQRVEKEISEVLGLDRQAREDFFVSAFSDEKTWMAILGFIASLVTGQIPIITAGAAVTALSSVGAKGFQAWARRRQKLKQSDYALLYTITRHP